MGGGLTASFRDRAAGTRKLCENMPRTGKTKMNVGLLLNTWPKHPTSFPPVISILKGLSCDQRLEEQKTKIIPHPLKTCDNYLQEFTESGNTDRNESGQKKHLKGDRSRKRCPDSLASALKKSIK